MNPFAYLKGSPWHLGLSLRAPPSHGRGARREALREGSIGASMLNVGDEILAVNDRAVSSSDEIAGALKAAPPRPVRLRVRVSGAVAPAPGAPGGPVRSTDWLPAGMRATLDGLSAPDADSLLWVHPKPPAEEAGNREIVINGEDIGHEAAKCDAFACHEFPWRAVQVRVAWATRRICRSRLCRHLDDQMQM